MKRNGKGQTKCGRQIETNTQTERGRQKERSRHADSHTDRERKTEREGGRQRSKLVFYAQSTTVVISGQGRQRSIQREDRKTEAGR